LVLVDLVAKSRHLLSFTAQNARQQLVIRSLLVPTGVSEVRDLGQARASRLAPTVWHVALLTVLPEKLANSRRSACRRGRRPTGNGWLGLGWLGGRLVRGSLGQLAQLLLQLIQFLLNAAAAFLEPSPARLFLFLPPRLFGGWGESPDVRQQAARLFIVKLRPPRWHVLSLSIEDSREQLGVAPPRLPGGIGEVWNVGQARAGLASGAARPMALLTVLPEKLADGRPVAADVTEQLRRRFFDR
jgi:hypothetical protein